MKNIATLVSVSCHQYFVSLPLLAPVLCILSRSAEKKTHEMGNCLIFCAAILCDGAMDLLARSCHLNWLETQEQHEYEALMRSTLRSRRKAIYAFQVSLSKANVSSPYVRVGTTMEWNMCSLDGYGNVWQCMAMYGKLLFQTCLRLR